MPPAAPERASSGPAPMDLDVSDVIDVEAMVGDSDGGPQGLVGGLGGGGGAGAPAAGARQLPPPPPPPQRPLANHVRECAPSHSPRECVRYCKVLCRAWSQCIAHVSAKV